MMREVRTYAVFDCRLELEKPAELTVLEAPSFSLLLLRWAKSCDVLVVRWEIFC